MESGKVKFFNEEKGFGFITPNDGSKDMFVHISAVEGGKLQKDDNVTYEVSDGKKGPCAVNVKVK